MPFRWSREGTVWQLYAPMTPAHAGLHRLLNIHLLLFPVCFLFPIFSMRNLE